MVTIFKHGKKFIKQKYKTKCACGCIFEFNEEDIQLGFYSKKEYVVCPECSFNVYNERFKWKKIK